MWNLREDIAVASIKHGFTLKYDLSLPTHAFYRAVSDTRKYIEESQEFTAEEKSKIITNGYGHIGDGNLHMAVTVPGYDDKEL